MRREHGWFNKTVKESYLTAHDGIRSRVLLMRRQRMYPN